MTNALTTEDLNRFADYSMKELHTSVSTNTEKLNQEEKDLIDLAINKAWINPKFKMKWFVGEMQITPFAKMRQWLLEIKHREEAIDFSEYEMNKLVIKIKRQQRIVDELQNSGDPLDLEEAELEIVKLQFDEKMNRRRLQDCYLERQHMVDLLNEFLESDEGKTEDGRSLMDVLDTEEEEVLEAHYWTMRLAKQASMDIIAYGRIGVGNMDAICQMSQQQQTDALALAHRYAIQLDQHQAVLRAEMARQLGLPEDYVPIIGLEKKLEVFSSLPNDAGAKDQKDNKDLENVYRI
jgi:hypothetical protein